LLRRFQATGALLPPREPKLRQRIDSMSSRETSTMRWKISHGSHDPRQIDLLAVLILIVAIIAGYRYFSETPKTPNTLSFVVPGQNVRW
jgi:hypothetical protein